MQPTSHTRAGAGRALRLFFLLLIAAGVCLRLVDVWRPIDYTTYYSWRESDLGMIARNFWRGDMNILNPQIDWGGDGPGYVESEFPLHAWCMAASYHLFGYHEEAGRVIALLIAIASLAAFHRLAGRVLPPLQALAALAAFSLNPILLRFATTIQPDPGMLLAMLLCVLAALRWREHGGAANALAAGLSAALAIMLKAPALCLGFVLAGLCFERHGWRALRTPAVWALAALALVPPFLWYTHAHTFWLAYGNSLGLSNETHWLGPEHLREPRAFVRLLYFAARIEAKYAFAAGGVALAAIGLVRLFRPPPSPLLPHPVFILYWLGGVALFYLAALGTSADTWAIYYHALSVPPACLLIGLGCPAPAAATPRPRPWAHAIHFALTLAVFAGCMLLGWRTIHPLTPRTGESPALLPKYLAAAAFRPLIPRDTLVVTLGDNPATDEYGRPIAHDDSALMFWLDRKGFTLPLEEHTPAALRGLARRGARFFIMRSDYASAPALQEAFPASATAGPYRLHPLPNPP